jgi:fido (protein-threonine AMPylation protein)
VPVPWNDDPAGYEQRIVGNLVDLLTEIARDADQRLAPTVAMAQDWHRRTYDNVPLPVDYYAGEVRDSDARYPELYGYEVSVGPFRGLSSDDVPSELASFEARMQQVVSSADAAISPGTLPAGAQELQGVLALCASAHGEWVRIHPFANGNGRTGRLWANWAALRYGLPPFVSTKPRPGRPYDSAAMASMQGDHAPMAVAFHQMLQQELAGSP